MWPLNELEKSTSGNPNAVSLEQMKQIMGVTAFNQEMLGRPGTSDEQFFKLDPSPTGRHAYWFEDVDENTYLNPRASTTKICFLRGPSTEKHILSEWLATVRLFMTVDTAYTEKTTSDRRACSLLAIDAKNTLFVLDMWSDQKGDAILMKNALSICQAWLCPIVFVEVVKESIKLYQRFRSAVTTRVVSDMGFTHSPAVRDLRPGLLEKTAKIATLDIRFEHDLIKIPLFRRYDRPWWTRLCEQIEGFSPESDNGGLEKDDEIDTVAMSLLIIKSKLLRNSTPTPTSLLDPLTSLREGTTTLPDGTSIMQGLPLSAVPADIISKLLTSREAITGVPTRV